MIVYKICSIDHGSVTKEPRMGSFILDNGATYVIGSTTTPEPGAGPLCAFDTLYNAQQLWYYSSHDQDSEWLVCRARKSRSKKVWHRGGYHSSERSAGTVLCDSITPLRLVTWDDFLAEQRQP